MAAQYHSADMSITGEPNYDAAGRLDSVTWTVNLAAHGLPDVIMPDEEHWQDPIIHVDPPTTIRVRQRRHAAYKPYHVTSFMLNVRRGNQPHPQYHRVHKGFTFFPPA